MRKLLSSTLRVDARRASTRGAGSSRAPKGGLLTPSGGLMVWTLVIFLVVLFILSRYAYPKILEAVEAREKSLSKMRSRPRRRIVRKPPRCSPSTGSRSRRRATRRRRSSPTRARVARRCATDMIEQAHKEQQAMLERARAEIIAERDRAIAELRQADGGPRRARGEQGDRAQPRCRSEPRSGGELPRVDRALPRRIEALMREPTIARNYAEALVSLAQIARTIWMAGARRSPSSRTRRGRRAPRDLSRVAAA